MRPHPLERGHLSDDTRGVVEQPSQEAHLEVGAAALVRGPGRLVRAPHALLALLLLATRLLFLFAPPRLEALGAGGHLLLSLRDCRPLSSSSRSPRSAACLRSSSDSWSRVTRATRSLPTWCVRYFSGIACSSVSGIWYRSGRGRLRRPGASTTRGAGTVGSGAGDHSKGSVLRGVPSSVNRCSPSSSWPGHPAHTGARRSQRALNSPCARPPRGGRAQAADPRPTPDPEPRLLEAGPLATVRPHASPCATGAKSFRSGSAGRAWPRQ